MKLKELRDKKILILGLGREGMDTFKFLRKLFPDKFLAVADKDVFKKKIVKNKSKIKLYIGKDYLKSLKNYQVIIKSPGISPKKIAPFINKNQTITSQTEIFFDNCPAKIIGITGTKGKGTTSLMAYQILKKAGFNAYLMGNIGQPVLGFLLALKEKDICVYELSSHQLYNLKKSPQIAVFLNIFPDHLDYYQNFKEYLKAKSNILLFQTKNDYLIYNAEDKAIQKISRKSKAKKIAIKRKYYQLNKEAVKAIGQILKIKKSIITKLIKEFKNPEHRLEKAGTFKKITFYNDSAATIPQATMAAIKSLGNRVETIILGGSEKNLDYIELANEILKSRIKNIILFPANGQAIKDIIVRQGKKTKKKKNRELNFFLLETKNKSASFYMKKAIKLAYCHTKANKICLLSPASASFGIFKNYKERGDLFKKYLEKYGC